MQHYQGMVKKQGTIRILWGMSGPVLFPLPRILPLSKVHFHLDNIFSKMKAILQRAVGAADSLYVASKTEAHFSAFPLTSDTLSRYIGTTSKPLVRSEALLVRVKAAGLNRADIVQRQGKYPPPPGDSDILGLEM